MMAVCPRPSHPPDVSAGAVPASVAVTSTSTSTAAAAAAVVSTSSESIAAKFQVEMNRLKSLLRPGMVFEAIEVFYACIGLARIVDYAVSHCELPMGVLDLPQLVKQVYRCQSEVNVQPAMMVLMLSIKNACNSQWFPVSDTTDMLSLANELSRQFSISDGCDEAIDAPAIISQILPRYFPVFKAEEIMASTQAKPGYNILLMDFHLPKSLFKSQKQSICLYVIRVDNMETSSCLVNPPQVNFLVNGRAVPGRSNVHMDIGPQLPTNITRMTKFGVNLFQAIGTFDGQYVMSVAITGPSESNVKNLEDYIQPAVVVSDTDVVEGPSRISLNCPISYKRIKVPVKGYNCKHYQCFDYDNYQKMNLRRPSWRCPHCNQSICCTDLRIDQNMAKILRESGDDISVVVISSDGSWQPTVDKDNLPDQFSCRTETGTDLQEAIGSTCPSASAGDLIDLTTETDGNDNTTNNVGTSSNLNNLMEHRYPGQGQTTDLEPSREVFEGLLHADNQHHMQFPHLFCEPIQKGEFRDIQDIIGGYGLQGPNSLSELEFGDNDNSNLSSMDMLVSHSGTKTLAYPGSGIVYPSSDQELHNTHGFSATTSSEDVNLHGQMVVGENSHVQHTNLGNYPISQALNKRYIPRKVTRVDNAVQALPAPGQDQTVLPRSRIIGSNSSSVLPIASATSLTMPHVPRNQQSYDFVDTETQLLPRHHPPMLEQPLTSSHNQRTHPSQFVHPSASQAAYRDLINQQGRMHLRTASSATDQQNSQQRFPQSVRIPHQQGVPPGSRTSMPARPMMPPNEHSYLSQSGSPSGSIVAMPAYRPRPPQVSTPEQRWNPPGVVTGPQSEIANTHEEAWLPNKRMRGSLDIDKLSRLDPTLLNQYLSRQLNGQTAAASSPRAGPNSAMQLPVFIANNRVAHGAQPPDRIGQN